MAPGRHRTCFGKVWRGAEASPLLHSIRHAAPPPPPATGIAWSLGSQAHLPLCMFVNFSSQEIVPTASSSTLQTTTNVSAAADVRTPAEEVSTRETARALGAHRGEVAHVGSLGATDTACQHRIEQEGDRQGLLRHPGGGGSRAAIPKLPALSQRTAAMGATDGQGITACGSISGPIPCYSSFEDARRSRRTAARARDLACS